MDNTKVIITLSNGEKLNVGKDTIIFPLKLTEHKGERFCSKSSPIVLEDFYHSHDGYIPELTTIFALNDYFTLDSEDMFETSIYKTSAIVSLQQTD